MTISPDRLETLQDMPDSEIDTSDIPELDETFWDNAKLVEPTNKKAISIRIDQDVLDWFQSQGKGYQSHINQVLRSYVTHQKLN